MIVTRNVIEVSQFNIPPSITFPGSSLPNSILQNQPLEPQYYPPIEQSLTKSYNAIVYAQPKTTRQTNPDPHSIQKSHLPTSHQIPKTNILKVHYTNSADRMPNPRNPLSATLLTPSSPSSPQKSQQLGSQTLLIQTQGREDSTRLRANK